MWIHKLGSTGCLEVLEAAEHGNDVLRENKTDSSKSISSLRKGFWNPGFLLGNQYNGKITTGCSSDAGCNQRVE